MDYQKNDNGRIEGTMDILTTEHIVEKTEFFKRNQSANDKITERSREWDEDYEKNYGTRNDNEEIISEVTKDGNNDA